MIKYIFTANTVLLYQKRDYYGLILSVKNFFFFQIAMMGMEHWAGVLETRLCITNSTRGTATTLGLLCTLMFSQIHHNIHTVSQLGFSKGLT